MSNAFPPYRIGLVYGPQLDVGGVEKSLLQLLKFVDRERFEPVIFSSASHPFIRQASNFHSQVVPWELHHAFDLHAARELKNLLRKLRIDMVHVHHPRAFWPASWAARALRLPIIATVHVPAEEMVSGTGFKFIQKKWFYSNVENWLLRNRMDRVIFVSERTRSKAASIVNAVTIPNGVELQYSVPPDTRRLVRTALHAAEDCLVLVAVGRLHWQKGYDILLNALTMLPPMSGTLQVWIAGEGQERAALEQQTLMLDLQDTVKFLGTRNDVPELFRAADVFLLPSRFEGMPFALLEAMAAGMAVISSDAGEAGNLVEDGVNGVLVPGGDAARLAAGIKTLQENPALRAAMGTSARARAADFEIESLVKRLVLVYLETIQPWLEKGQRRAT